MTMQPQTRQEELAATFDQLADRTAGRITLVMINNPDGRGKRWHVADGLSSLGTHTMSTREAECYALGALVALDHKENTCHA